VGDAVEVNWLNAGRYYPGKITRVCGDGTYDFAYTDGTPETALPLARIRRPAQCAREGDTTVEVNGGFVGKVTRDCRDDVYEVVYTYMNEKTTTTKPITELRVLR